MKNITLEQLSKNFDCNPEDFSSTFVDFFNTLDMRYEALSESERDSVLLEILHKLKNDKQIIGAPERTQVWHDGWKENLDSFASSKSIEEIVPKFIRPNKVIRYNGNFIKPCNPFFERDFAKLIQIYCYDTYIKNTGVSNVYEFGCGSSFNLITMLNLSVDNGDAISFYGSDFVQSSVDLCNQLSEQFGYDLNGYLFDMIKPDYDCDIHSNSCVFTFGAIEQLDSKFENFIDYLLSKGPKVCFHIEPTIENYNPNDLFDYLQISFHSKRGYTQGLLPHLKNLESLGKIKILKNKRLNFGSKFMEGYHLYAWEIV